MSDVIRHYQKMVRPLIYRPAPGDEKGLRGWPLPPYPIDPEVPPPPVIEGVPPMPGQVPPTHPKRRLA